MRELLGCLEGGGLDWNRGLTGLCLGRWLGHIGGERGRRGPIFAVTLHSQSGLGTGWGLGTGTHTMGSFRVGCSSGHFAPRVGIATARPGSLTEAASVGGNKPLPTPNPDT